MEMIDLRSDTLTRPDAAMRRAMAEAEVGDDVYGDDPTVRRLEEESAEALGCAAAIFVPSGIMGNQIGLRLLAPPGSELLCDERSHVVLFEKGAMSALSGIQPKALPSADGVPSLEAFQRAYKPRGDHWVPTGAIALENTHNMAGGRVHAADRLAPILAFARERGLAVHLDGARIWNAAVALDTTPAALARGFDTVMACFSKGLGAPVGSILASSRERIEAAREIRTMFGGAMRQVGVLAAAALVGLRHGRDRLAEDHLHARRLAVALADNESVTIDPAVVDSNIGIFQVSGEPRDGESKAARWCAVAREAGLLMSALDDDRVRFVTHRDVPPPAIDRAVEIARRIRI